MRHPFFFKQKPTISRVPSSMTSATISGFTLFEVILAMAVIALLAGSIYAISNSAITATKETLQEQLLIRRLEGFIHITRRAFWNLPGNAKVYLQPPDEGNSSALPDLIFENATGLFGVPSLGGGSLTLSARAKSNGTRTFSILRLPKNIQDFDPKSLFSESNWVELLPNVKKPTWSFYRHGQWLTEWSNGSGRPQLVRLQMEVVGLPDPIEAIFYVPAILPQFSLFSTLPHIPLPNPNQSPEPPGPPGPYTPPGPPSPPGPHNLH